MKVFQNLTIDGSPDDLDAFLNDLVSSLSGWRINKAVQERMERAPAFTQSRRIAIDTPVNRGLRAATLFLFVNSEGNRASVGNILPDTDSLTAEEYNSILQSFTKECVRPKAASFRVHVTLSSDEYLLNETLSPHNMNLLECFVGLADKNTGSHHPHDYRRWIDFIAASIRDRQILDYGLLQQWLMEQGFPRDVASDLCQEYEFSVDLSKQLGSAAPEQDKVSAAH